MKIRKIASWLIATVLFVALIPVPAFAADAPTLQILTEAVYDEVSGEFVDGLAWVRNGNKYAYIDENGKIAIDWFDPFELFGVENKNLTATVRSFREGYAQVLVGGVGGFINKAGTIVVKSRSIDPDSELYMIDSDVHEGYVTERISTTDPYMNGGNVLYGIAEGNANKYPQLPEGENGVVRAYTAFYEGKCVVTEYDEEGWDVARVWYIDRNGNKISGDFDDAKPFHGGLAMALTDGYWGVIDESCKYIVRPQYDAFWINNSDYEYAVFTEGIAWVQDGQWGAVDKTGKTVVPFEYETGSTFSDGMSTMSIDGKTGYIDTAGKFAIPAIYDDANYFYNGVALVAQNGTYKLIDKTGAGVSAETWKFDNTRVDYVSRDMVFYQRNGKWGVAKMSTTAAPPAVTAVPNASSVLVNGKTVAFDAYTINQNNYFKLRDLAFTLSGTKEQFELAYDNETKAITITSGKVYTPVGGEMTGKGSGNKTPTPTASKIYLDGKEVNFTVYTIEGNNYFKLRDVASALDFYVGWDGTKNTITIDTNKEYIPE
jgi:hypothetical protein